MEEEKDGYLDNLKTGSISMATGIIEGLTESLKILGISFSFSAKFLGNSTKETVVQTVEHKYGNEAGKFAI